MKSFFFVGFVLFLVIMTYFSDKKDIYNEVYFGFTSIIWLMYYIKSKGE